MISRHERQVETLLFLAYELLQCEQNRNGLGITTVEPLYSEPPYSESLFIVNEFLGPLKTAILYIIWNLYIVNLFIVNTST